jgi:hypothetical protein
MRKNHSDIALRINRRELATILAALRFHQEENLQGGRGIEDQAIRGIATDGGLLKPLNFAGVGKLCQKLNLSEDATAGRGLVIEPPHLEGGDEPLFRVAYVLDVGAVDPLQAARRAHRIMADPRSQAPVLEVIDHRGKVVSIDLSKEGAGSKEPPERKPHAKQ